MSKKELAFGAAETEKDYMPAEVGFLIELDVEVPNFTNDVTATIKMIRPSVDIAFPPISRNQKKSITVNRRVKGDEKITVTLSGVPGGAGGTVALTPYLR